MRRMSGLVAQSEEMLRKIEQDGYNVFYTAAVQNYMDRKNTLDTNLGRAYACTYFEHILQWDDATPHQRTSRF